MRFILCSLLSLGVLALTPLSASAVMRGEVAREPDGLRQSVVRVESSRGELCSGAVIGPDLVLTAAHCVIERTGYRVVVVDRGFRPRTVRAIAAALHPAFVPGTTPRTQPGVDLAILKLERPLGPEFAPLDPRGGGIGNGEPVEIAGFGVVSEDKKGTARVLRRTQLMSLGAVPIARNRVVVAVDARRQARTAGAGACRGDSGGPILRGRPGAYQLVGIVSWSSGALHSRSATACGGLTAVTPVAEHASWIAAGARDLSRMQPRRRALPGARAPTPPGASVDAYDSHSR
jgi:hypothetical protein